MSTVKAVIIRMSSRSQWVYCFKRITMFYFVCYFLFIINNNKNVEKYVELTRNSQINTNEMIVGSHSARETVSVPLSNLRSFEKNPSALLPIYFVRSKSVGNCPPRKYFQLLKIEQKKITPYNNRRIPFTVSVVIEKNHSFCAIYLGLTSFLELNTPEFGAC